MDTETVLVTDCSSGVGRATAREFLADGWTVSATARGPSEMGDLEEEENTLRKLRGLARGTDRPRLWKRLLDE